MLSPLRPSPVASGRWQGSAGLGVMKAFGQSSAFKSAISGLFSAAGGGAAARPDAADHTSVSFTLEHGLQWLPENTCYQMECFR